MDLLEHPLEAFAFRLYSLPEASAWTCLAAILAAAAAAGLWRLRAFAPPTAVTDAAATKALKLDPSPAEEAVPTAPSRSPERWPEPVAAASPSPKERYTAYFRDACRVGCCDDEDVDDRDREDDAEEHGYGDVDGAYRAPSVTTTDPFGGWEEVVRTLPISPTVAAAGAGVGAGLRPYRSPRALGGSGSGSGSVVQLWDQASGGALTPTASPRRRGRVVATVPAAF